MATKFQRIMRTLSRALERGDIDEATHDQLTAEAERAAEDDMDLAREAERDSAFDEFERRKDYLDTREEYRRDHARDYRKHER